MIKIHDKAQRGWTQGGLSNSFHTFAFGTFADPSRMGFGALRVLNEDRLIPGGGFAPHDHADMDILTIVLAGELRHEDDQGNIALIKAGEVQGMSAGTGVTHSEFNASQDSTAHFLQIWMIPDAPGGAPSYAQETLPDRSDVLLAGPEDSAPLLPLRSQSTIRLRQFEEGDTLDLAANSDDQFVHLMDGMALAETERVSAGDGLQIPAGEALSLTWQTPGQALVFTMPKTTSHKPEALQ